MNEQVTTALRADLYIEVDYVKGRGNASRAFQVMSDLIRAMEQFDRALIQTVDGNIESYLVLEEVETSSIRALLDLVLRRKDDELYASEWQQAAKRYLVEGKYLFSKFISRSSNLADPSAYETFDGALRKLARKHQIGPLSGFHSMPRQKFADSVSAVADAVENLDNEDKIKIITPDGTAEIDSSLKFSDDDYERMVVQNSVESSRNLLLKIKKPEFLTDAQWEFKYDGHVIHAKIKDLAWLRKYQNADLTLNPGDAIEAKVKVVANFGFNGEVVSKTYTVEEVIRALPNKDEKQFNL